MSLQPDDFFAVLNSCWNRIITVKRFDVSVAIYINDAETARGLFESLKQASFSAQLRDAHGAKIDPSAKQLFLLFASSASSSDLKRTSPRFIVASETGDMYQTDVRDLALERLISTLHMEFALNTSDYLFIHAGVVVWYDQLLVFPGYSHSGKSTLVMTFVRAGATYYSDEYAVIDQSGQVHPYLKPIHLRHKEGKSRIMVEQGQQPRGEALSRISWIFDVPYVPGSLWSPSSLSPGQQVLTLLKHTVAARKDPAFSLSILHQALRSSQGLRSPRGEAEILFEKLKPLLVYIKSHKIVNGK